MASPLVVCTTQRNAARFALFRTASFRKDSCDYILNLATNSLRSTPNCFYPFC